jgi:hypothetical protein
MQTANHCPPAEDPDAVAQAIEDVIRLSALTSNTY